jgi:formate--tetrahydrofolate ligase
MIKNMTTKLLHIKTIAKMLGVKENELILFGDYKAKIKLDILDRIKTNKLAKYIVVTAITPSSFGEGKTTTTIGLAMGLTKLGYKTVATLRQPSLGPVFGIKGGGTGGGKSKILPSEDINLHFTGDTHSVTLAHNLCSAFLDNVLYHKNFLNIDVNKIFWRRVIDINDRALRKVILVFGQKPFKIKRITGFDITSASEVMAILSLSKSFVELKNKINKIVVAFTKDNKPVFVKDLKIGGGMSAVLKYALMPNLVQSTENTPVMVHSGPFANIAHGNSSIISDLIATRLADYVVTESGFGADCGMEKFVNIKCRYSGLKPDCTVLVCSIRSLKIHSGKIRISKNFLPKELFKENLELINLGLSNLQKQIENVKIYNVPVVVAINKFSTDTEKELLFVQKKAIELGADDAVVCDAYSYGSKGTKDLARSVTILANKKANFKFLYPLDMSIKEKIEVIATKVYGAKGVKYSSLAEEKIKIYTKYGWDKLPVCIAKTQLSLSHNPNLKGRPQNFVLPVKDIFPSVGAGFLYVLCGDILTMPGLPINPVGTKIDIDKNGNIIGLV